MPFETALTAGELNSLRGTSSVPKRYEAGVYLSTNANTQIYAGRVNMSTLLAPATDVTYDGATGTLANVRIGMTVLFSATNDQTAAYFRGFVRKTPTASILYVNESGESAPMADNDYFWVIEDFAVFEILPRDVAGAPVPAVDQTFRRLKPIIGNLKSCYADFVDSVTGKYTIALAPSATAADNDATGAITYLWTVPSGVTITVGTSTDKDITIACDPGEYWIDFRATDSNSTPNTFHFKVWAHDANHLPVPLQFGDLEVTASIPVEPNEGASEGHSASVAAFAGVSALLDHTLVCAWVDQRYNGTAVDIGSTGNILMVGRFRSEANSTDYDPATGQQDARVTFPIEGALQQLVRRFPTMEITHSAAPDAFNEVEDLTVWRAVWLILSEYSTFGSLHSLKLDDSTEGFLYKAGFRLQGGDLLYSIADLLQGINSVLQDNAAGMCELARRLPMLPTADRAAVTTVADFDQQDYERVEYSRDYLKPIGLTKGDGGGYNSTLNDVSAYLARAPKGAPSGGPSEGQLPRQILTADQTVAAERSELTARLGHALAAQQTPETLTMQMPAGYWCLTPDVKARYTWTLAASETVRGKALTTAEKWQLMSRANRVVDPGQGVIETTCTFIRETSGVAGQIDDLPPLDMGPYGFNLGDLPALIIPALSSEASRSLGLTGADIEAGTLNGSQIDSACVGGISKIRAFVPLPDITIVKSISLTYTASATITSPSNKLMVRLAGQAPHIIDQWTTVIGSNQTHTWTGQPIATQFIGVELYGDDTACVDTINLLSISYTEVLPDVEWTHTFDFAAADGGFAQITATCSELKGVWVAATGWRTEAAQNEPCSGPNDVARAYIALDITDTQITYLSERVHTGSSDGSSASLAIRRASDQTLIGPTPTTSLGANVLNELNTNVIADRIILYLEGVQSSAPPVTLPYIFQVTVKGRGTNPFV